MEVNCDIPASLFRIPTLRIQHRRSCLVPAFPLPNRVGEQPCDCILTPAINGSSHAVEQFQMRQAIMRVPTHGHGSVRSRSGRESKPRGLADSTARETPSIGLRLPGRLPQPPDSRCPPTQSSGRIALDKWVPWLSSVRPYPTLATAAKRRGNPLTQPGEECTSCLSARVSPSVRSDLVGAPRSRAQCGVQTIR